MDVGTGIFLGLVFVGVILLYLKTRDRWKWKRVVGYPLAAIVGVVVVGSAGYGLKYAYEQRVTAVTQFMGIKIADTQGDIKFKKGNPTESEEQIWNYKDADGNYHTSFSFNKNNKLSVVLYSGKCSYCNNIFDLGVQSSYDEVIEKLGQPEHIDTSEDSLMRVASFAKLNLLFQFAEGKVIGYGMYNPVFGPIEFKKASDKAKEIEEFKAREKKELDAISTVVE